MFGTTVWTPEIFPLFIKQRKDCEIPQQILEWSHRESTHLSMRQIHRGFFPNRDPSSRRGTKQATAWDQGRNLALSTFHFLKPLDFVMCLGWESGQVGKWSDVKLKILDFPSTWCQQLIDPKTVIPGTERGVSQFGTQIANSGASKIRKMTLFQVTKLILFRLN